MSAIAAERPIDAAALWRSLRFPAVIVLTALALITILAAIGTAPNSVALDPRNAAPDGTRALAALLADRGVSVTVATTLPQIETATDATIVASAPGALSARALKALAGSAATVLLIDPEQPALTALGVSATVDAKVAASTINPGCSLPAAVTAGSARIAGDLYAVRGTATACYQQQGDAALLKSTRPDGARTLVLGSASTMTNADLAAQGDAALALGLLDTPVVQWVPGGLHAGVVPASRRGLFNLLPARLLWATLQLFIALGVFALWRARRLGRVVVEPLPVVVRAAETVEGRARLMHAARARGTAGRALRAAAIRRMTRALRLGADDDPESVVALVAERTHRPAAEIRAVLYGDEPRDDASLVRLAQSLPRLETSIRQGDVASAEEDKNQ